MTQLKILSSNHYQRVVDAEKEIEVLFNEFMKTRKFVSAFTVYHCDTLVKAARHVYYQDVQ